MLKRWFGAWTVIYDGTAGLLYRDGVYTRTLAPGRHWVGRREHVQLVRTARQMLTVTGQEVLSNDGFQPRLTAIATIAVLDPYRAESGQQEPFAEIVQLEIQLALRALASARPAEALAREPRQDLDAELLAAVRPNCTAIGVDVEAVRLRDVHLPTDLRRLLTAVDKARREGQAALERAHAEQASLRALANAARMLRNNPELQNLRLLQSIGTTGAPTTIVLGTQPGIIPLRDTAPPADQN